MDQSVMSVAISEISHAFNAHFNNGQGMIEKSENLSQLNSARTPSNYCMVSNSINQGEAEDVDAAIAARNIENISGGASSRDNSSAMLHG